MAEALTMTQAAKRTRIGNGFFYSILYTIFVLYCLTILYPFYFLLINSLQAAQSIFVSVPNYLAPTEATLANYGQLLKNPVSLARLFVSFSRVFIGTALNLSVSSMVAFGLRRRNLKLRNFYLILFTIPMFFSGGLIPQFLNYRTLGVFNTFFVYVIPSAFSFFNVIIFMSCFRDIPDSLEESARMDGAAPFFIFIRIYVPLSIAVYATLGLFSAVSQWEAWFDTAYFTNKPSLETFSFYLMKMVKKSALPEDAIKDLANRPLEKFSAEGTKYASMIVASVPVIIIYPFVQKYFVTGLKIGAIKG